MAEKPKTYPQQIQELKQIIEERENETLEARTKASLIPALEKRIAELEALVSQHEHVARQAGSTDKAKWTDLEQRAISAEQGLKNAQAANTQLRLANEQVESQLDFLSKERDKVSGLTRKLELVAEELKTANMRVASLNQQLRDKEAEAQQQIDSVHNQIRQLRAKNEAMTRLVTEIRATIYQAPDVLAQLRNVQGL